MTNPRLASTGTMPKPHPVLPERRPLILTYGLLAALLAVFACEYAFRIGPMSGMAPSINTLAELGALDKALVV